MHIPGLSVAVVEAGEALFARGYGLENVEVEAPARAETVYEIGSLTKQFTAAAVMALVDDGIVSLDDRLMRFLLGLPVAWDDVTLRHLLSHTSGIRSYTTLPEFAEHAARDVPHEEVIDLVAGYPLTFAPGTGWEYSNTGYFLLGMVLERLSGKLYCDLLRDRIFAPLGMAATGVYDLHALTANRADGYEWSDGVLTNPDPVSPAWSFATGGLASTVVDLAKWDAALDAGRILKRVTLARMWTPACLADGTPAPYGFGWFVDESRGRRRVHHAGGIRGFRAQIMRFPEDRVTAILLCNLGAGDLASLAEGVLAHMGLAGGE